MNDILQLNSLLGNTNLNFLFLMVEYILEDDNLCWYAMFTTLPMLGLIGDVTGHFLHKEHYTRYPSPS